MFMLLFNSILAELGLNGSMERRNSLMQLTLFKMIVHNVSILHCDMMILHYIIMILCHYTEIFHYTMEEWIQNFFKRQGQRKRRRGEILLFIYIISIYTQKIDTLLFLNLFSLFLRFCVGFLYFITLLFLKIQREVATPITPNLFFCTLFFITR